MAVDGRGAADFVTARWSELEAVALLATLDPVGARETTAAALTAVRNRWAEVLEEGRPTATARDELLARLARSGARPRPRREPPAPTPVPEVLRTAAVDPADPDDPVPLSLLAALARETPGARAVLAAGVAWDDDTQARPPDDVRARLLDAHRSARAAAGLPSDDRLLGPDLVALVERLARTQPDPPDPAVLVEDRVRGMRRRSLVVGGALAAGVAATGWAVGAARDGSGGASAARRPAGAPTTAGPDDPAWTTTSRWPARGRLATDAGVRAVVDRSGHRARLLWADDVHGVRVVVAARFDDGTPPGSTRVEVWSGPLSTPAARLAGVPYAADVLHGSEDVVALGVPAPRGAVLVVLGRPGVRDGDFSPVVHPTAAGSVERTWRAVPVRDGVGSALVERPWGSAGRVRCGSYDGYVLVPTAWGAATQPGRGDPVAELVATVASATGLPRTRLRGEVVVDSIASGSVIDPFALSATDGDGRVVLTRVTTPEGAVVRAIEVHDDGRSTSPTRLDFGPFVVPADAGDEPAVVWLDDIRPGTGRYLVVVPAGGRTCRLLATSTGAHPLSKAVPLKGRSAVVPVLDAPGPSAVRLVVEDAAGRRTYDGVPPGGRDLFGAAVPGTTWLGLPADHA